MNCLKENTADAIKERADMMLCAVEVGDGESEQILFEQITELVENYRMALTAQRLGVIKAEDDWDAAEE